MMKSVVVGVTFQPFAMPYIIAPNTETQLRRLTRPSLNFCFTFSIKMSTAVQHENVHLVGRFAQVTRSNPTNSVETNYK
jgi:hypothetical protein